MRTAFSDDELNYLRGLRYVKSDFVDFLALFHFNRAHINIRADGDDLAGHRDQGSVVAHDPV